MRAPVGGLFRHVIDLAKCQVARGHQVGLIADAGTGAARAEETLRALAPLLALGVARLRMSRHLGWSDLTASRRVAVYANACAADVVHGHGAKGGAYARLTPPQAVRVYTPHGGSLHYRRSSPLGVLYLGLERLLMARTELFLFESAYGRDAFTARVGKPTSLVRVVHNGVSAAEFTPVALAAETADVVFVGELRRLKGVDVLLESIGLLAREGHCVSATVVGEGPDASALRSRADALGLNAAVRFAGALPARAAFALGRVLVVPSRAESLPYIVLEAGAAGRPIVATTVGGIPEIFGPDTTRLVPPANAPALAKAIRTALADAQGTADAAGRLQSRIRERFSLETMTDQILAAYSEALARAPAKAVRG